MSKLKMFHPRESWEEAEAKWEQRAQKAGQKSPLKGLRSLPQMPGITQKTKRFLKWKSFRYMATRDVSKEVWPHFWKHPLQYAYHYLRSLCKGRSCKQDGDFYLYGIDSEAAFKEQLKDPNTLFVVGFSYCEKPFECPSGRFSSDCIRDADHPVCQQCHIGKCLHALPEQGSVALVIPTVHYIGGRLLELKEKYPEKRILFLITACELTLEMFGDWGNMAQIQGIGVRLAGRICNTMRAFELSEQGIKPGLTLVLDKTRARMLELIRFRREEMFYNGASGEKAYEDLGGCTGGADQHRSS